LEGGISAAIQKRRRAAALQDAARNQFARFDIPSQRPDRETGFDFHDAVQINQHSTINTPKAMLPVVDDKSCLQIQPRADDGLSAAKQQLM
jgi:hypothetical protein